MKHETRVVTRVKFEDSSALAEVWVKYNEACPYCGGRDGWTGLAGEYRICLDCNRGWGVAHEPHTPANNSVLAQVIPQLPRGFRGK